MHIRKRQILTPPDCFDCSSFEHQGITDFLKSKAYFVQPMAVSLSQSPTLAKSALALMPAPCKPVSDLASEMTEPDVSFMRLSEVSNSPVLECQESDDMPEWEEESDEHEEVEDLRPFRNSFHSWSEHDFEHPPMSPNRLVHEWHLARLEHLGKALPRCHGALKKVVAESRRESVTKDKDNSWSRKCMETMAAWSSSKIWTGTLSRALWRFFFLLRISLVKDWRRCQLARSYWSVFALVSPGHLSSFFTLKLRIFSSSEKFSRTQCHSGITSACDLHGHVAWTCQTGPMVFVQGILFSLKLRIFSSSEKSSRTQCHRGTTSACDLHGHVAWTCQTGPMVFVQGILFSLKLRIFSSSEKSSRTQCHSGTTSACDLHGHVACTCVCASSF